MSEPVTQWSVHSPAACGHPLGRTLSASFEEAFVQCFIFVDGNIWNSDVIKTENGQFHAVLGSRFVGYGSELMSEQSKKTWLFIISHLRTSFVSQNWIKLGWKNGSTFYFSAQKLFKVQLWFCPKLNGLQVNFWNSPSFAYYGWLTTALVGSNTSSTAWEPLLFSIWGSENVGEAKLNFVVFFFFPRHVIN